MTIETGASRRRRVTRLAVRSLLATALLWAVGQPAGALARRSSTAAVALGAPAPVAMNQAAGVACSSQDDCWVVGLGAATTAAIVATTDGGASWRSETVPATVNALAAISCPGRRNCLAVGNAGAAGAVLVTGDGGATWQLGQDPPGAAAVPAVDCTGTERCVVLATDGSSAWSATTADLGSSWIQGGNLPTGMTAAALSCASGSSCVAVGSTPTGPDQAAAAIAVTSNGGTTWTAASVPGGAGVLRSVSCTGQRCVAVGTTATATTGFVPGDGALLLSLDGGATWQEDDDAVGRDDAFSAACPDGTICVVVGTDWVGSSPPDPTGRIVTTVDGGGTWRPASLHYVPVGLAAVACPAVNHCVAAGGNVLARVTLPVRPPASHPAARPGRAGAVMGVR